MTNKDLFILALGLLYGAVILTLFILGTMPKSTYDNLSITILLATLTAPVVILHYAKHKDDKTK
jgi:hypothetical protein